jgi:(p)ppGpp synthase/HD superfamily hydrolase
MRDGLDQPMDNGEQVDLIDRAIEFAVEAHEHQKRKGTETAYIIHPFSVALILAKAGCSDEMIVAGILHDTVEDTPVQNETIREKFGETVASIVESCSEPDKTRPWEERKEHTLRFLKNAPLPVRLVSCADKLHNLRTIARELNKIGDEVWVRFNRGKDEQKWYYESLVKVLCGRRDAGEYLPVFEDLRKEVERVFGKREQQ